MDDVGDEHIDFEALEAEAEQAEIPALDALKTIVQSGEVMKAAYAKHILPSIILIH